MKRIAVLASGGGRSFLNLIERRARGKLHCEIALLIASAPNIGAVQHAIDHGIPVVVAKASDVASALDAHKIDLAVLAGYLKRWPIPEHWQGRAINIHPALLPKFGGKGFFGHHVHEAVLAAGDQESGCTVHWVTPEYDSGSIIAQRRVPVLPGDCADSLAARVFAAECELLPEVVESLVTSN
jgi:formyltetrahydrofolate-dependent phosphoribosylglycinamide formyltransferase